MKAKRATAVLGLIIIIIALASVGSMQAQDFETGEVTPVGTVEGQPTETPQPTDEPYPVPEQTDEPYPVPQPMSVAIGEVSASSTSDLVLTAVLSFILLMLVCVCIFILLRMRKQRG